MRIDEKLPPAGRHATWISSERLRTMWCQAAIAAPSSLTASCGAPADRARSADLPHRAERLQAGVADPVAELLALEVRAVGDARVEGQHPRLGVPRGGDGRAGGPDPQRPRPVERDEHARVLAAAPPHELRRGLELAGADVRDEAGLVEIVRLHTRWRVRHGYGDRGAPGRRRVGRSGHRKHGDGRTSYALQPHAELVREGPNTLISTNQFKNGNHIEVEGTVFKIIEFQHVKPGKGGAFVRTKLRRTADGT